MAGNFKSTGTVSAPGSRWSLHERGNPIDSPEPVRAWMRKNGAKYRWINLSWAKTKYSCEPWHFEFDATKDTRKTTAKALKISGVLDSVTVNGW